MKVVVCMRYTTHLLRFALIAKRRFLQNGFQAAYALIAEKNHLLQMTGKRMSGKIALNVLAVF